MVLGLVVRNVARVGQQRAVQHARARGHARLPLLAAARERVAAVTERTAAGLVRGVQAGACRPGGRPVCPWASGDVGAAGTSVLSPP
jgi:hypothetical protein